MTGSFKNLSTLLPGSLALVAAFFLMLCPPGISAQEEDEIADIIAIFNQAQDLHEKGDLKGAVALYEKALLAMPEFPEAEYQRGVAYLALGDTETAEKAFRGAVKLRPDWALAKTSLGSVLIRRGARDEALALLQEVVNTDPNNPPALAALTELRLHFRAPPPVLKELLERVSVLTLKANPSLSLWTARAALETALGQIDAAKDSVGKALAIDPSNKLALALLGDVSLAEGDIEKAREITRRIDIAPGQFGPADLLKARVHAFDGRFDDALALLNEIQADLPGVSELRSKINTAKSTSPESLERQLQDNERDPAILGRLCSLYRLGDPAKALGYCQRASAVEPNNISHAIGFGAALVQARQFESAVDVLAKIIKIAPDNSTARANLATALFQLKRYPEAKTEFHWLAKEQPRSAGAFYFLGILHDQMTEYMDAAANYQQYLRLADPVINKIDIERVNLRIPQIQRLIREGKGKKIG
jgi:tetratricopeptide (TPR) repeat protein